VREGLQKIVPAEDTIVAISTPPGRSGIGVVRISGPEAESIGKRFLRSSSPLNHQRAVVGKWQDLTGAVLDDVVVVLFRGPHSYTGEDLLEISAHGNPLTLNRIVGGVQSAGARIAGPGEFTLRAVGHGKMDLLQAEAVRDFIEAQTDGQARTALRQMSGALSNRIRPIKEGLVDVIARLEAGIDFAEDDVDIPDSTLVIERLEQLRFELQAIQETYAYGRMLYAGVRVVIVGRPNVGKSSLFNRLVAAERAIVTEVPGTTRDVLSEVADLDGIPVRFFDTAGLHGTTDRVEKIGVERTIETLSEADLALFVVDGSVPFGEEDRKVRESLKDLAHFLVANKADMPGCAEAAGGAKACIRLSAKTGAGLDTLTQELRDFLGGRRGEGVGESVLTNARQNDSVLGSISGLRAGEEALVKGTPQEMVLLDLYSALSSLNELTGETTTEDILGRIFSTFCIGK